MHTTEREAAETSLGCKHRQHLYAAKLPHTHTRIKETGFGADRICSISSDRNVRSSGGPLSITCEQTAPSYSLKGGWTPSGPFVASRNYRNTETLASCQNLWQLVTIPASAAHDFPPSRAREQANRIQELKHRLGLCGHKAAIHVLIPAEPPSAFEGLAAERAWGLNSAEPVRTPDDEASRTVDGGNPARTLPLLRRYLVFSCFVLSCLVLSCLVLSCYVTSCDIMSCHVLSRPVGSQLGVS